MEKPSGWDNMEAYMYATKWVFVFFNSYAEALIPNMMVYGGGTFKR